MHEMFKEMLLVEVSESIADSVSDCTYCRFLVLDLSLNLRCHEHFGIKKNVCLKDFSIFVLIPSSGVAQLGTLHHFNVDKLVIFG